jgi:RNA polymerase sigma-70 factor (family 1)
VAQETLCNERQLVLDLSQGDEVAFEKLYYCYNQRLFYKLLKLLRSPGLAQELLQEVFLAVWDNRKKLDPAKSFRSWLFCIAANKCYDLFRKAARDKKLYQQLAQSPPVQCNDIESDLINRENASMLSHAIEMLPPRRREIFRLCKVDGKSYEEVSMQLGISLSTISDHIVKANNFIRKQLLESIMD